jgi:hypothetical protein
MCCGSHHAPKPACAACWGGAAPALCSSAPTGSLATKSSRPVLPTMGTKSALHPGHLGNMDFGELVRPVMWPVSNHTALGVADTMSCICRRHLAHKKGPVANRQRREAQSMCRSSSNKKAYEVTVKHRERRQWGKQTKGGRRRMRHCARCAAHPARPFKHSDVQRFRHDSFQAGTWWGMEQTDRWHASTHASLAAIARGQQVR